MSTDSPTLPLSEDERRQAQQRSLSHSGPPTEVRGYVPERFLGAGAYGEVWMAIEQNTRRHVAIKFYSHRGGLDWSFLSREVEKLAFLSADRYVVQLLDVGWDAEPPYYIMEFCEHGSLADRLRDGPVPAQEAIALFRDLAVGLVHAHGKGILHCDLKPANVLLDQDMRPRLADFGQSRLSNEQTPALGTLFFMAPEQASLHAAPDARWDVYALGALLYCLLTGEPPYRSAGAAERIATAGPLESQLSEYVRQLSTSPRPTAHRHVPGVDRELADIIDHCLTIDPRRRFANPQAVLGALDARATRLARRPLMWLGAIGPALLLVIVALFFWREATTAVGLSETTLVDRALEGQRFASRLAAENVARQIDRRWYRLEHLAAGPKLARLVSESAGQARDGAPRQQLQKLIEATHENSSDLEANIWFVMGADGTQLARSPLSTKTIDHNFAFRDYFHGQRRDLPPETRGLEPITYPHRSHIFNSRATGEREIAITVPIWNDPADPARRVVGVLGVQVELGDFAELPTETPGERNLVTVLVDLRGDDSRPPMRGQIIEHPFLERYRDQDQLPPRFYLTDGILARIETLRELSNRDGPRDLPQEADLSSLDDYLDPVGGDYAGRWLAAIEPVIIPARPAAFRDADMAVIVQERLEAAIEPAHVLGYDMAMTSLWAFGTALLAMSALWFFVMFVLNQSPRGKLNRRLARWWYGSQAPIIAPGGTVATGTSQEESG
ncbi:MAG: protein kinase [Planctomycetes bacterium]|nr:protein kinase [Planctomycetota bacterium]